MTNAELEEILANLYELSMLQGRMLASHRALIDGLLVGTGVEAPLLLRKINEESEVLHRLIREQLRDRLSKN